MIRTNQQEVKCHTCRRHMEYGAEGVQVQHIICGPRGLIPLGQAFVFCSDECHESYFNNSESQPEDEHLP